MYQGLSCTLIRCANTYTNACLPACLLVCLSFLNLNKCVCCITAAVTEANTNWVFCPHSLHLLQVLLLSARDGLLSRLVLSGAADAAATARFSRLAFGAFATRAAASAARSPALMSSAAAELLERSGLPELEQRVLTFLCEAAGGVKLLAVLDDAGSLLDQLSNVAGSAAAALAADAARLSASREALQAELNATLASFDGVTAATQELQIEAVDEVRCPHVTPPSSCHSRASPLSPLCVCNTCGITHWL